LPTSTAAVMVGTDICALGTVQGSKGRHHRGRTERTRIGRPVT
jgi:hypothetical protein